jgi:UDP-glucose 4-epimerase
MIGVLSIVNSMAYNSQLMLNLTESPTSSVRSIDATAYSGKHVLVTGGAGFIGGHLCQALQDAGAQVRALDNLSTGRLENLPRAVELVVGDVADAVLVRSVIRGCSYVFHLAAMVSVPASVSDPAACFASNILGTEQVIRAAVEVGVDGFVHTSSSAVYGASPSLPSRESDVIACESPYAASKACGEFLVQAAARSGRLPGVSLRLFNVFGLRQDPKSAYAAVVSAFIDAAVHRRACDIYGSGLQTRDFIPVHEVVSTFLAAGIQATRVAGEAFNVGLGRATSVRDLAASINRAADVDVGPVMHPARAGDVEHSRACVDKARTVLGVPLVADLQQSFTELFHAQLAIRPMT